MNLFEEVPIGTVLYGVHESYYYDESSAAPYPQYVITEEVVCNHFEYKYKEVMTSDGKTPREYRAKDIGTKVFLTRDEAVAKAEKMADAYDLKWMKHDKKPMRRPWRTDQ